MTDPLRPRSSKPIWLSDFIRTHSDDIMADWLTAVRSIPIARDVPKPVLLDHLPALLARIADMADEEIGARMSTPESPPIAHALARLEEGYDLGEVVTEYAMLRECILRHWEEHGVRAADPSELRVLNRAIDHAISISVARFTTVRERTLTALDRISATALGHDSLDTFLPALLLVLKETTPAVDWATLMLRDGELLVVRATVGLEEDEARQYNVTLGEGIAGRVARDGVTLVSRGAADDPRVASSAIRAAETRAMVGLPLLHDGEVIGVAEIGSLTAAEFSDEDRLLFNIMATRATAMIEQHHLREIAEHRAAEAQRATQARDDVLAVVSHDLRNPLSAIMVAAAMMARVPGDLEGVRRKSELIQRSAQRMSRLLEDLLDVSKIEAGQLTLSRSPYALDALVREVLEMQRPLAEEKSIHLAAGVTVQPSPVVLIDRESILRVFANLIGNAIKFTPPGGAITVATARRDAQVCVSIADTGPGMPAEHLSKIFDRFWQARDNPREGAGLGLAIVKGIVEAHAGEVWAESLPDSGSTFSFTLPLAPS